MPGANSPGPDSLRQPSVSPSHSSNNSKTRDQVSMNTNGVTRTRSVRTAANPSFSTRGAATKRPASVANREGTRSLEDDSKAATAALVEDLKAQLAKAESASEEYQKQLFVVQSRLDEATVEQTKLEEAMHKSTEKFEALEVENKAAFKLNRELESRREADQSASMREREEAQYREEELTGVVQRLKESIMQREARSPTDGGLSRAASFRGRASPNPESMPLGSPSVEARDSSQSSSKLILQKDRVIEDLRLELAEAQIRLVEVENAGGGRMRELEKVLLETRMANARLMEETESYQVLLSERTLNGDFTKGPIFQASSSSNSPSSRKHSREQITSSLADELENVNNSDTADDTDQVRKVEGELAAMKAENKALTLYINKIITRLLQSEQFETLFAGESSLTGENTVKTVAVENIPKISTDKELPAPPTEEEDRPKENTGSSLLQRAGSIFGGRNRPRPQSIQQAPSGAENLPVPTTNSDPFQAASATVAPLQERSVNENPDLAPSLPLRQTNRRHMHQRSKSEWSANIVNNMYRGPPSGNSVQPVTSPGLGSPRQISSSSFFTNAATSPPPPLVLEDLERDKTAADRDSALQALSRGSGEIASDSGYGEASEAPSPPRSSVVSTDGKPSGGTVFSSTNSGGSKMRPLRLVQEKKEAEEAALAEKKKANRSSFMGWFQRPAAPPPASPMSPPPLTTPPPTQQQQMSLPAQTAQHPHRLSVLEGRSVLGSSQEDVS